jgi:hypothetical protein
VQHEAHPFGGTEPVEQHGERGTHAVVEGDAVGRVGGGEGQRAERLVVDRALVPVGGRPQLIEAEPARHDAEPRGGLVDAGLPAEAQERLLHDVLGALTVAQHPLGDPQEARSLVLPGELEG